MNRYRYFSFVLLLLIQAGISEASDIHGRIILKNGAPVAGARVELSRVGHVGVILAISTEDGSYRIQVFEKGAYILRVTSNSLNEVVQQIDVSAESHLIDVEMSDTKMLDETVTVAAEMESELKNVPGGTSLVTEGEIRDSRAHNLADVVNLVPGVIAQSRFGADESQFSIRGSGLRNNFHMRGLNILVNGIPYQDADGFSDFETIDLMATQQVEIWKGANALRYGGNSLGGAINFRTNTGEKESNLKVRAAGGSFGFLKAQVATGGIKEAFDYYISFSGTEFDGYRQHSEQSRQRLFSNFSYGLNSHTRLRFDFIYANVDEQLPGSLTQEEFDQDPDQADPENVRNRWGRNFDFYRMSTGADYQINQNQSLEVTVFGQYRNMVHPIFQILDQDAHHFGAEFRYTVSGSFQGRQNNLVVGFSPTFGENQERRYENISGTNGDLTARFSALAGNYGIYFENDFNITSDLTLSAGGRYDRGRREFEDLFLVDGNRSDKKTYSVFSPKIGMLWKGKNGLQFFGNINRAYEPPLLLELTSFGAPGFLDLKPQDAWQFEIGSRGTMDQFSWDASFYDLEISDEIININVQPFPFAPFTIPSYRNVDRTRHLGLEFGVSTTWNQIQLRGAYTLQRFRFLDDPVYGDNNIPGAPHHILRLEGRYNHDSGIWVAPALDWSPADYFVDSANLVKNQNYTVFNLKAGFRRGQFSFYIEGSNLLDEKYSGSVQVDNALGRFFEPSAPRSFYAGIEWKL